MDTNTDAKLRRREKRQATEAAIVAAFDRLVRREGLRSIGVNAVVKEAGVGKGLIYKYFGGLAGVVRAWGEQNRLWPSTSELMGSEEEAFRGLDIKDQLKNLVLNHANALRSNRVATDVMADELMVPSEISTALSDVRKRIGREHQAIFGDNKTLRDYDNLSLLFVLLSAANYLAMRAARAPRYMGEMLDTDAGWNAMMERLVRVLDLATGGASGQDERAVDADERTARLEN